MGKYRSQTSFTYFDNPKQNMKIVLIILKAEHPGLCLILPRKQHHNEHYADIFCEKVLTKTFQFLKFFASIVIE